MPLFFQHLSQFTFLKLALAAGILASICCGVMGSYVVVRRRTYIVGAISHCLLAGMGAARYARAAWGWTHVTPLTGAVAAALLAAWIISLVGLYGQQREDTILSAVWAVGMAVGVSFICATPGYNEDLMSYLFGNILMVSERDLWLMAGLDAIIVIVVVLFYDRLLAISFHEETARLRGIRVGLFSTVLLVLTALTVVLLVQIVGIVMVIALLTLPAAAATQWAKRLWQVMVLGILASLFCTIGGLALSYGPELPAGATVVELAGATYLVSAISRRLWRKLHRSLR